jgi:hypothetical protein
MIQRIMILKYIKCIREINYRPVGNFRNLHFIQYMPQATLYHKTIKLNASQVAAPYKQ